MISKEIYGWFNGFAPFLIAWIAGCTLITTSRIILKGIRGHAVVGPSSFLTELPALPIVILQTACFCRALAVADIFSALLFLWWGPGFWMTLGYLVICKKTGRKPNWHPYKKIISWLCKLNYVSFMATFVFLGFPTLVFVYSVWIINDQYGMAFLSLDADRLRRTFHDHWFVRILYPLGLGWPWIYNGIPYAVLYKVYGAVLLLAWIAGIAYVRKKTDWMKVPDDPTLLRNMVYFAKPVERS